MGRGASTSYRYNGISNAVLKDLSNKRKIEFVLQVRRREELKESETDW